LTPLIDIAIDVDVAACLSMWCDWQRRVIERPSPSPPPPVDDAPDAVTSDSTQSVYDTKELDQLRDILLQRDNEISILSIPSVTMITN